METSSDTSVTAASTVAVLGGGGMGKVTSTWVRSNDATGRVPANGHLSSIGILNVRHVYLLITLSLCLLQCCWSAHSVTRYWSFGVKFWLFAVRDALWELGLHVLHCTRKEGGSSFKSWLPWLIFPPVFSITKALTRLFVLRRPAVQARVWQVTHHWECQGWETSF